MTLKLDLNLVRNSKSDKKKVIPIYFKNKLSKSLSSDFRFTKIESKKKKKFFPKNHRCSK